MGFFSIFKKNKEKENSPEEHAFILTLNLSNNEYGEEDERNSIHELSDLIAKAIETAGVGEFDGDEFGEGKCTLYMYGPNADELFDVVHPLLKNSPLSTGAIGIKRYGEASNPDANEKQVKY
ncbi:MAG: hypothetical protein KJ630_10435 [Proteobacteria bacterium]|nr:hypothetical protein [Pseudomonadota bacterium]